jgi:hypothetical protein
MGYLKSDKSLYTGDIIEYYGLQTGASFDSATGESYPEYEEYPIKNNEKARFPPI